MVDSVRQSVQEDPTTSTRRRSAQLGIGRTTLRTILKQDLKMVPYKIQTAQALLLTDHQVRLNYATGA